MIINISYDSSVASCPQQAAFKACVAGVVNFYESAFSDPITVNIHVGWGELGAGQPFASPLPPGSGAASVANFASQLFTYAQVRSAFGADAKSASDTTAVASLGATDPTNGGQFSVPSAEAKALGLITTTTGVDGWTGIDATGPWVFNTTNTNGANVPQGSLDAFSFLAHEFAEILGRQMDFGDQSGQNIIGAGWYPYDLFDYSKSGVRALTHSGVADRYFSIDGGVTNTGQHWFNNDINAGDLFDWVPNGQAGSYLPNGPADSYDYAGSAGLVSAADQTLMDVLGYNPAAQRQWLSQVSGTFATPSAWSGGVTPGAATQARLTAAGATAYTVTASASATVSAIQTAATATLAITGGVFTATHGTGTGANGGSIAVKAGATLAMGGTFYNTGSLSIAAGGVLQVAAGGLSISGSHALSLAGTIKGAATTAILANLSTISGSGALGGGQLTLQNLKTGLIESLGSGVLTIDTGAVTIANLGLIEANGTGGLIIKSALANTGKLIAQVGTLEVDAAVTGAGTAQIAAGVLHLLGAFKEAVSFLAGATGSLILGQSQGYTGKVSGLSKTGANSLVLSDISFISGTTMASYSGTTASGVLSVTDGTHTAKINLVGDYTGATFKLSAAAGGGVKIVDPAGGAPAAAASTPTTVGGQKFVSAMAAFLAEAGAADHAAAGQAIAARPFLAVPRFMAWV